MKILLTTLHAKYSHASLALPCLASFCRDMADVTVTIREYTVNEPHEQLLRQIMAGRPDMVAFSCYIWNIERTLRIASDIRKIAPEIRITLGGPEVVSGIFELMHANPAIDFVVKGEGELVFRRLLETLTAKPDAPQLLEHIGNLFFRDGSDIIAGAHSSGHLPLDSIPSPFAAGLVDLARPLTYYETSRGCPFSCAFCLSSIEGQVRSFSMERIEQDLLFLMQREVPKIKLVDRTFNYDAARADHIWRFILANNQRSHFHFEIAADLLTNTNIELLQRVPRQTFRFEIGIQSASQQTLAQVNRKTDLARAFSAVRRLREETMIELHLDLVAGLPGEDYQGFLNSLHTVAGLAPHEIQIEPLKVLKGSPMREIADREDYHFSAFPPYTILRNPWLSFDDIGRIETVGRLLDLFHNNGGFETAILLLSGRETLAQLLDRMAVNACSCQLSGISVIRRYELFFELGRYADDRENDLLADALFFDFCSAEIPRKGKLPGFASGMETDCSWPARPELPENLELAPGGRVKSFRCRFKKDYRQKSCPDGSTVITFVHESAEGQGLRVIIL